MAIGNRRRSKNNKTVFNLVKKAATVGVVSTLQNSTIDWSIANVYTKQITSNEILEFVNDTDGKTIHLVLENTSESPVTVSFPGGLHKSSSLQDILQAGTQSIYTLVKAGNDIYITQDVFTDLTSFADTDGDGVTDNLDAFPNDPTETVDSDGDGVGDNADAFPLNALETLDTDGDGVGDNSDNAPLIANPDQADLDQDGIADVLDSDIDGDGVINELDAFPFDPTRFEAEIDTDGDGIPDSIDIINDSLLIFDRHYTLDSAFSSGSTINGNEKTIEFSDIMPTFDDNNLSGKIIKFSKIDIISDEVLQEYTAIIDGLVFNNHDVAGTDRTNLKVTYSNIQPEVSGIENFQAFEVESFTVFTIDSDGDGVSDNIDNAPLVFNPDQSDIDQDGIADVLDEDVFIIRDYTINNVLYTNQDVSFGPFHYSEEEVSMFNFNLEGVYAATELKISFNTVLTQDNDVSIPGLFAKTRTDFDIENNIAIRIELDDQLPIPHQTFANEVGFDYFFDRGVVSSNGRILDAYFEKLGGDSEFFATFSFFTNVNGLSPTTVGIKSIKVYKR